MQKMCEKERNALFFKKAQLSVFVIIALVIVGGLGVYLVLKNVVFSNDISDKFMPVEQYYLDCISDNIKAGVSLLESQGGYIYTPAFVPGSEYMPSSSQLNFLGSGIPFWYYVTGNNYVKEQIPSKLDMENQLERFIEENSDCNFRDFTNKGYFINQSEEKADVKISNNKVSISVKSNLQIGLEEESALISNHESEIETNLGSLYTEALKIYNHEKQSMFLEKYALDTLYLYAPVTGVELPCAPKIWLLSDIEENMKDALEANTMMLKVNGNYYTKQENKKYFIVDVNSDKQVQFLYSKDWPTKFEATPQDNGILMGKPVGNQAGLGIMGFCYVPYHFVYDLSYPVLIQLVQDGEIFQFPVVVVIKANKEREVLAGSSFESESQICQYGNNKIDVYTYDINLNPVEANINFKCLNEECEMGKTSIKNNEAILTGNFPPCVNGVAYAKAEGYETKREIVSSNEVSSVNIVLDKLYEENVTLKLGGKDTQDLVIISFESDDTYTTLVWPEQKTVKLSEGSYNISAYSYKNSSISLPASTSQKCVDSPKSGLLGVFGQTESKCFDVTIPAQKIESSVSGGGKIEQYITETELQKGNVVIRVESVKTPTSLEELQKNYDLIDTKKLGIEFI